MKRIFFKISLLVIILIVSLGIIKYLHYRKSQFYYEDGENDIFKVKVGETFKIKFYENASTGYLRCWLNNNKERLVVQSKREYIDEGPKDCIGCGSIVVLNFKAVKKGMDKLKFANCPVGREQKTMSYYTERNTKPDNEFVVKITE